MTVEVIQKVSVASILPNPWQPVSRINIDMLTAQKFAESIKEHGLLQVPICRRKDGKLEMGDGWLRLAGYRWLVNRGEKGYEQIDVIVKDLDDRQMADLVLEANTVRKDLNPIELAQFYKNYLGEFGLTQDELAKKHGVSQGEIANTIRLLELPEEIQQKVILQEITPTHGRTLLQLDDPEKMLEFAGKIKERGMSVAELNLSIKNHLHPPRQPELTKAESVPAPKTKPVEPLKDIGNGCSNTDFHVSTNGDREEKEAEDNTCGNECDNDGACADTCGDIVKSKPEEKAEEKPLQKVTMEELKAAAKLRKVTLTETADGVLVAVMREGGMPFMKKVACALEDTPLRMILDEAK